MSTTTSQSRPGKKRSMLGAFLPALILVTYAGLGYLSGVIIGGEGNLIMIVVLAIFAGSVALDVQAPKGVPYHPQIFHEVAKSIGPSLPMAQAGQLMFIACSPLIYIAAIVWVMPPIYIAIIAISAWLLLFLAMIFMFAESESMTVRAWLTEYYKKDIRGYSVLYWQELGELKWKIVPRISGSVELIQVAAENVPTGKIVYCLALGGWNPFFRRVLMRAGLEKNWFSIGQVWRVRKPSRQYCPYQYVEMTYRVEGTTDTVHIEQALNHL